MKYDIDMKAFWEENNRCMEKFSTNKSRVPLHFWLDDHFIFEEAHIPSTLKYYKDEEYRLEIHRYYNDRFEKLLGRRYYDESPAPRINPVRFEVTMGSRWQLTEGGTPWLESDVKDIEDVKHLIDRMSELDLRKEVLPEGWHEEKERFETETGKKIRLGSLGSRGPCTMATSILGTENTCIFIMEAPEIMDEFFKLLCTRLIEYNWLLKKETGEMSIGGYWLTDDNSYLFPPAQYERFCAPFLDRLFKEFAPDPKHTRFQHSDSSMGHLMGILNDLGVNDVNFGPSIHPLEIRKAMPKAYIQGQIPPFTLRNGTPEEIIDTVRRDIESVGQDGGLMECPAGSVAAGTPLENLRIYMWAVQTYGRYK